MDWRLIVLLLIAASMAGCQSTETAAVLAVEHGYPLEFSELSCAPHGRPNGEAAALTASRIRAQDRAYIEIRQRLSPAIPSGHLYVVFGRLDEAGEPVTRQYIGLYPAGLVIGLYGGAIVPMPAHLKPNYADCRFTTQAAYRVSLSEHQYGQLTRRVREILADPPLWHMVGFNCNHFAASLGETVGLKPAENRMLPAFAYIHAMIEANEGPRGNGA